MELLLHFVLDEQEEPLLVHCDEALAGLGEGTAPGHQRIPARTQPLRSGPTSPHPRYTHRPFNVGVRFLSRSMPHLFIVDSTLHAFVGLLSLIS